MKKIAEEKKLERLQRELQAMKVKLQGYEAQVSDKIKDNPKASVGIAFGAGVALGALVGYLMNRRWVF